MRVRGSGRLVRFVRAGGVIFFGVGLGFGFAMTSPPLPWPADIDRLVSSKLPEVRKIIMRSKEAMEINLRILKS